MRLSKALSEPKPIVQKWYSFPRPLRTMPFYWLFLLIIWRERVEVESTTRSAKDRVAGFEGREGHRTPFAPRQEYHH